MQQLQAVSDLHPGTSSGPRGEHFSKGGPSEWHPSGEQTAEAAHDFNNILAVVMACAAELEAAVGSTSTVRERATEIREAAESGARLTRSLMTAPSPGLESLATIDLNAAVFDSVSMIRRLADGQAVVRYELGDRLPRVGIGRERIEQCLLNLARNALDAMAGAGTLTLRTSVESVGGDDPHLSAGSYACFSVSDDGSGMAAEVLERVTESRFTTKASGSGLGLPTVMRAARDVGGELRIRSAPGIGTTVSVLLPGIVAAADRPTTPAMRFGRQAPSAPIDFPEPRCSADGGRMPLSSCPPPG